MKGSDELQFGRLIPSRIRTLMIANVVIAVGLALALNFPAVVILAFVGIVACGPLVLVESYLYRKKKGVCFQWQYGPARPARDIIPSRRFRSYRRTLEAEAAARSRVRTQLFESSSPNDPVSRAALLLIVGNKLAQAGKRQAAERCYRQILERFADAPEARQASRQLSSPGSVPVDPPDR